MGLTLNNLSCSYKRDGNIEEAQNCLKKALELQENMAAEEASQHVDPKFEKSPQRRIVNPSQNDENRFNSSPRPANNEFALTELNLCAIFSQKGDHMKAKMYAHSSIYKLKQDIEYLERQLASQSIVDKDHNETIREQLREKQSLLAIAHYNLGCQQEYLKEFQKSMESYRRAFMIEKAKTDESGKLSQLANEFLKSYKDMKRRFLTQAKSVANMNNPSNPLAKKTFSGLIQAQVDDMASK